MNVKNRKNRIIITFILMLITLIITKSVSAGEKKDSFVDTKYGIAAVLGDTYDPDDDIDFYMLSGLIIYDHEKVLKYRAPDQLRFKLEGSIGSAHYGKNRLVASINIFALRYLDFLTTRTFKPYIEGGIGIIYSDFQVQGQGLRVNFNPQLGIGTEIKVRSQEALFISLRLHHISNGGLDDDNRGVNSVMGMFGFYF